MNYYIKRELQEYGPYTLADLQRYVASGNILLTDLTRSEGLNDWVPVSQVIGNIPVPVAAPAAAVADPGAVYPAPPSLHWGIVLLLGIVTCGIFGWIWALIEASWLKRVEPSSKAMTYYIVSLGLFVGTIVVSTVPQYKAFGGLLNLAGLVMWLVAAFNMKSSLEEHYNSAEPIGLRLSGVMTFFFNVYYFQYHLTRVAEMKNKLAVGAAQGA
ncbi:MAG: DUF4339 domain-containing protein [Acidobacteria bacterium]|nr:MAG: DUF4339 domain-containing protein [Acidobacteriota bacterium]